MYQSEIVNSFEVILNSLVYFYQKIIDCLHNYIPYRSSSFLTDLSSFDVMHEYFILPDQNLNYFFKCL